MVSALITSSAFLACYLYYHFRMQQVYGERTPDFEPRVVPSHLSDPAVHAIDRRVSDCAARLMTVSRAIKQRSICTKKSGSLDLPIWMYVSVTGVVIYFLLYQIFPQR